MRLSFSKLDLYEFCPYAYRFRYVARVPVPFAPRLVVGAIVHAALKGFFERLRDGQRPTRNDLLACYEAYWASAPRLDRARQPDTWERGVALLRGFWEANRRNLGRPVLLEARFRMRLASGAADTVEGVIDRVDEAAGGVEIIDYKSGRAPDQLGGRLRTQLHTYALAVERQFGMRPVRLTGYFLSDNQAISTVPEPAYADQVVGRFTAVGQAVEAERFGPTPDPRCASCDYGDRCPYRWRGP